MFDYNQLFKKKMPAAGNIAKDRLKLVLIHDRINCSPELLEMMKSDIIAVISKYVEVDLDDLNIQVSTVSDEDESAKIPILSANIPIKNLRKASEVN
ncbi:MAG: cell division topological specificity factor MinE [Epulopiscium sp. Nele67-Bin004]|nr:MAG: cell division topological specificity factor MinE [Epulopiscium sp. Nele67-Bin004]